MDEPGLTIKLRSFDRDADQAFIYSSWRNQAYYSAYEPPLDAPKAFFKELTDKIKDILDTAHIIVACLEISPQTIVGYSVSTGPHLNWVYVKEAYRKAGIGTLLVPKNIETFTNHLTKIGRVIAEKKNLKLQGERNG